MIPGYILILPALAAVLALLGWLLEHRRRLTVEVIRDHDLIRKWATVLGELEAIKRQRSATTAKGNRTRAAKRKAERDAMTARLNTEAQ